MLQGRWPSPPSGIPVELIPAAQECLIYLSSLPKFVFLLLWFSRCWNKHGQKSPAWLRLHLLWWELLGTSGRPKPGPPNLNLLKPGLAFCLEISPWILQHQTKAHYPHCLPLNLLPSNYRAHEAENTSSGLKSSCYLLVRNKQINPCKAQFETNIQTTQEELNNW